MRLLVIESPYAAGQGRTVAQNVAFARAVIRHALSEGWAPFASHLFYPGALDDADPAEREQGISAGLAWAERADAVWICLPPNTSPSQGMLRAYRYHSRNAVPIEVKHFTEEGSPC